MDYLLIVTVIAIVFAIGYILSRPFLNPDALREAPSVVGDYHVQYQTLLGEIKTLEGECEVAEVSDTVCDQLEEKKRLAANLLRLIHPHLDDEFTAYRHNAASELADTQPELELPRDGSYFCQQCGSRVISSDKFCTRCGHRLQP